MAVKAPTKRERDELINLLNSELQAQLEAMPTEILWDTAKRMGVAYERDNQPRRRADIIDDIVTKEIERAREETNRAKVSKSFDKPVRSAPSDPDLGSDGSLLLTLEEMALAFAVFLPQNAQVYTTMQRAELFTRTAQRVGPNTVVFTRPDREGNDRQYHLTLDPRWAVNVTKGE